MEEEEDRAESAESESGYMSMTSEGTRDRPPDISDEPGPSDIK